MSTESTDAQQYEWAVHNAAGMFVYADDEDGARGHAESSGSELLRRPVAEWESVATYEDEDEDEDEY